MVLGQEHNVNKVFLRRGCDEDQEVMGSNPADQVLFVDQHGAAMASQSSWNYCS